MKIKLVLIMLVSMAVFAVGNVAQADTIEVTVTGTIQAQIDDIEETLNSETYHGYALGATWGQGYMYTTSSDLEVGHDGDGGAYWQLVGLQFSQMGIPQGATITAAKIIFTVDQTNQGGGTEDDYTIMAEAADNAVQFGTADFDASGRARTAASVSWVPGTDGAIGTTVDTSDITTLIQEVVDRGGWSDDNRLTLLIFPDVYLALADPATGGPELLTQHEYDSFSDAPGKPVLSVTFEQFVQPGPIVASAPFAVADTVFTLTAPGEAPWEWSLDGTPTGDTTQVLTLDPLAEGDAGLYSVTLENGDGLKTIVSRSYVLEVFPSSTTIPVAGLLGLGLLASACAMGGASVLRRKK